MVDSKMDTAGTDEFFQRNLAWMHRKNDKVSKERDDRKDQELVGCTFRPETHEFVRNILPILDFGLEQESEYKMVFDGKTYDLAKEKELQEFLMKSIARSGQRSIFKKSNDTTNKIYEEMMK